MISLSCKSCGEKNQVESFLAAAQQNCMNCGQPLMGGGLARPAPRHGEPKPWERLDQAPDQVGAGTRNISVQAVASINFLFGVLYLTSGLLFWISSSTLKNPALARGVTQEQLERARMILSIMTTVATLMGLVMLLAGAGLLARAAWARYLALGLAGLSAVLGLLVVGLAMMSKTRPDACTLALYALHSGITFFVLLQPQVAAEFGSPPPPEEG